MGGIVQLELRLPGESSRWNCTARVVRVEEVGDEHEIGVKIVHVEGADLYKFQSFLADLQNGGRVAGKARKRRAG